MNTEFMEAIEQIGKEKGIDKETLMEAINAALISAYKKNFGTAQNVRIDIDSSSGQVKVYALKKVVESVNDDNLEIDINRAKEINPVYDIGDVVEIEVTPKNFGRIAAQNAKQVVIQRIREAERTLIYEKFLEKENEVIPAIVQRVEKRNVYVDMDMAEGILPLNEQMPNEKYQVNDRIRVYITDVKRLQRVLRLSFPGPIQV